MQLSLGLGEWIRESITAGLLLGVAGSSSGIWVKVTCTDPSRVTPIKTLVADALGAPLDAVYRMELAPASVTVISYFLGGSAQDEPMANLRLFNARPTEVFG